MPDLDLNLLYVLVALARQRSVSAAAHALKRSQPAISVALGKLREFFEDPLFIRTGNVMQPTPRALTLVKSAQAVLERIEMDIVTSASFDPHTRHGAVTLALSDVGEVVMLPAIMKGLRQLMPHATIRSVSLPPDPLAAQLERGAIDLAIGYFPDLKKNNFFQQVLYFDTFAGVIRADHPVTSGTLSIAQYLQLEHAVVRVESRTEEVIERYLAARHMHRRIALSTPHFASAPIVVAQSDLIVTIPKPLAQYFTRVDANLRVIGLPFKPPQIALKQFWHRRYNNDARNRWLRALICNLFQDRRPRPSDAKLRIEL